MVEKLLKNKGFIPKFDNSKKEIKYCMEDIILGNTEYLASSFIFKRLCKYFSQFSYFWQNFIFVKINGVFLRKRDKNIIWEVVTYLKSKKEMIFSRQFRTVAAVYHSLKIFRQNTTKTECPLAIWRFFFQNKRARFIIGSGHWTLHYSNKPVDPVCCTLDRLLNKKISQQKTGILSNI